MKKRNKEKDIIRFVFDEMKQTEADSFLTDLCSDDELWDTYEEVDETVAQLKEAEVLPSQESLDNIMAFVESSKDDVQEKAQEDNSTFLGVKLHKLLTVAMAIFLMVGVTSSVYKIRRSQNISPDHNNVAQTFQDEDLMLDWEGSQIDQSLEEIRSRIEILMSEDQ
ncbi:MAG: hypothetical protein AAFY71_18015 [Bacteroidota bacterium]